MSDENENPVPDTDAPIPFVEAFPGPATRTRDMHLYRVESGPDITYVEATHMQLNHGVPTLWVDGEPVAAFYPHAGMQVVRVDMMTTTQTIDRQS